VLKFTSIFQLQVEISIRFAETDDLPAIVAIYNQAIRAGNATADLSLLSVDDRSDWLESHPKDEHPVYLVLIDGIIVGWGSISPYRKGRAALQKTAEISYYIDYNHHRKGLGKLLIEHMIQDCSRLGIKNIFAVLLEVNLASEQLLIQTGFEKWGFLPKIADLNGKICGQFIYGMNF